MDNEALTKHTVEPLKHVVEPAITALERQLVEKDKQLQVKDQQIDFLSHQLEETHRRHEDSQRATEDAFKRHDTIVLQMTQQLDHARLQLEDMVHRPSFWQRWLGTRNQPRESMSS